MRQVWDIVPYACAAARQIPLGPRLDNRECGGRRETHHCYLVNDTVARKRRHILGGEGRVGAEVARPHILVASKNGPPARYRC